MVNGYSNNKCMETGIQLDSLKVALRVLAAYSSHNPPEAGEETYLRNFARDNTTPGDELACQIVQAELRKLRSKDESPVTTAESTSNKHRGHAA